MKEQYSEYYKKQLDEGREYEDFVYEMLYRIGLPIVCHTSKKYQLEKGENKAGLEVKYDKKYKGTGNLYIEIAEKADPKNEEYVASGIYREDNTWWWAIGDYEIIYLIAVRHLRMIEKECEVKTNETSKGFLLPKKKAEKLAMRIIETGLILEKEEIEKGDKSNEYIEEPPF